jgi:hypothetical protein
MPAANTTVNPNRVAALLECYEAAVQLVPAALQPEFVLIGGAASMVHGSVLKTEDVDIAVTANSLNAFREAVARGQTKFKIRPCETIEFECHQGYFIPVEFLELGGPFVDSVAAIEPLMRGGFVASPAELFLLRAKTWLGRGEDGDLADLRYLLEVTARTGQIYRVMRKAVVERIAEVKADLTLCERLLVDALFF